MGTAFVLQASEPEAYSCYPRHGSMSVGNAMQRS
nr:MAG TPA: hypothetical protein [Caudoviricetes sp.]